MPSDRLEVTSESTDVVGARVAAQVVDLVCLFLQVIAVTVVLAFSPETESELRGYIFPGFVTLPLDGGLREGFWNGQTVGKRMLGIKVVNSRGDEPGFGQALVRNVPAVILFTWISTAVGLAAIAINDRRQRLFDEAAGTYVVRIPRR